MVVQENLDVNEDFHGVLLLFFSGNILDLRYVYVVVQRFIGYIPWCIGY